MLPEEKPLRAQLEALPSSPGVYQFKNAAGEIIYVGKAKSLRSRVGNYFGVGDGRTQVPFLMREAHAVEVLLTSNEKEALLLENQLIKQHQPRYNVELKDDKNYLCLRIDQKQKYPRVEITRRLRSDGARYFGPYHSASMIRQTVRLLNRHFLLRTCRDTVFKNRKRPCLQYEIKRCPGPCVLPVDAGEYGEHVKDAVAFLEGRHAELVARLKSRMQTAANAESFEQAAEIRDQLGAVEASLQKQRVMQRDLEDRDVFGIVRQGDRVAVQLLLVRDGNVRGGRTFDLDHAELELPELLEDSLRNYYDKITELPREVLLPMTIEGQEAFEQWLRERRGAAVDVLVPERGDKKKLVELAMRNAQHRLKTRVETTEAAQQTLERLQRSLRLQNFPERIECYDISNTQGGQIVGSQVVFEEGVPAKGEYRLFKMRHEKGQDDFASMHEMLTRRLKRGLEEGEMPSLIVIDGGIGQLNVARAVFMELGVEGVDLCALAKSRALEEGQGFSGEAAIEKSAKWDALFAGEDLIDDAPAEEVLEESTAPDVQKRSPERVFLPGKKNPIVLKPYAQELLLLTHLRDEAHRFAITFHRKLRKNRVWRACSTSCPVSDPSGGASCCGTLAASKPLSRRRRKRCKTCPSCRRRCCNGRKRRSSRLNEFRARPMSRAWQRLLWSGPTAFSLRCVAPATTAAALPP